MSNFRALTLQSGVLTQIAYPDLLDVGAGLTTSGVNLSIAAAAGYQVTLGSVDSAVEVSGAFTSSSNTQAIFAGAGGISVTGAFSGASLSLTGDGSVGGNLSVSGSTLVTGTLSLTGALTGVSSGKFLSLTIGVTGEMSTTEASIDASGNASFNGNISAGGNASITGNASVGDSISVTNSISADSAALTSSLTVGAGEGPAVASIDGYGNISLDGNISAGGDASIMGNAVVAGTLGVTGLASFVNVSASGNLTVTGATTLTGSLTGSSGSLSGNLSVTGESSVGGNTTVGASLSVTGDISGTNGSLAGNLDVTGNLTASDISGVNGSFTGNVDVSQDLSVTGNLTVSGAETIIGVSSFTNDATFNGNVTVADAYYAHLLGNVTLGEAGKSLTVDSASTFNGNVDLKKAVVISGDGSSLDFPAGNLKVDGASVTATMTAAALNVLFGGVGSVADAYHTHDAVEASDLVLLDVSAAGVADGYLVKMSGDLAIALASNDTISNACVVGARDESRLKVAGAMKLYFEASASAPSAGARVYLGAAGKASKFAPESGVALKVGVIVNASSWSTDNSAIVLLQVGDAVVL